MAIFDPPPVVPFLTNVQPLWSWERRPAKNIEPRWIAKMRKQVQR